MSDPLHVRWDRTVIHSTEPGDDTIVCCLEQHGHPVALFLDDELREALGLQLLLPDGDGEVDPQHLELVRENDRLRAELVAAQAAGYREAASDAALVLTHDADATTETLLTFLREGAEGREKFAANVAAAASATPVRNCFTDAAYRSKLTDSPERPCDRVQPHPAHKHVAQRASWQCPGVAATTPTSKEQQR